MLGVLIVVLLTLPLSSPTQINVNHSLTCLAKKTMLRRPARAVLLGHAALNNDRRSLSSQFN